MRTHATWLKQNHTNVLSLCFNAKICFYMKRIKYMNYYSICSDFPIFPAYNMVNVQW